MLQHRLVLVAGHDEYWSTGMRQNLTAARDAGVSLAFFGANDAYWHTRLQDSPLGPDRVEICYKDATLDPLAASDPTATTVRWRDSPLNQPENALLGEMYAGIVKAPGPLQIAAGALPFLKGSHLQVGSVLPGLIGPEFDHVYDNGLTPPGLIVLTASTVECKSTCPSSGHDIANATLYTTRSGARVFDAGTFQWGWGLDDFRFDDQVPPHDNSNPDFGPFTANVLAYLLASPPLQ
jgi:hypothetical protein